MSFPRRLPSAGRKIDYAYRTKLVGGALAYTVGFGVVGEYFGWWDHFQPMTDRDNPVDMVEMIQKEDATTWKTINMQMGIGLRKLDSIREQSYRAFEENIPVGLKTMINDEAYDMTKNREKVREEIDNSPLLSWLDGVGRAEKPAQGKVFMHDKGAPFFTKPREVGTEDLVTFTSSKKTPSAPATEPEPAETTKDTSTDSKQEAAVESESKIKDTESPPSNNPAKSYSSPL